MYDFLEVLSNKVLNMFPLLAKFNCYAQIFVNLDIFYDSIAKIRILRNTFIKLKNINNKKKVYDRVKF